MLVYMINELITEKGVPMDKVQDYLNTYSKDFVAWYKNLDVVSEGWRKPFFKKYLPEKPQKYLRKIFAELGERQILNRIAREIEEDSRTFSSSAEAREFALEMLMSDLGYLQKYDNKVSLLTYILGCVPEAFRDKANIIKQKMVIKVINEENIEERQTDPTLLFTYESRKVRRLFESMIEVDKIFVTANQSADYRQYSFLSAYQLWWFRRMVARLNRVSREIDFTVHDFNSQNGNREHVFITKMFDEVMPTVELIDGTADLRQLVRKLTKALHGVEGNTGVNIPITFVSINKQKNRGVWHEDSLHHTMVDQTKRGNFEVLLDAFIALGRFHNLMESAGVEFPSFYPDIAKDSAYLFKFDTLADYINHSSRVLTALKANGLPSHLGNVLKPVNPEKSAFSGRNESLKFNEFLSRLSYYVKSTLRAAVFLDPDEGYKFMLMDCYETLAEGRDPLHFILCDYPDQPPNDFKYRQFERLLTEALQANKSDVPAAYITIFYKRNAREKYLPLFIALYKEIIKIHSHLVKIVGDASGADKMTGGIPSLLVTDTEFSMVTAEHNLFAALSTMDLDEEMRTDEGLVRVAALMLNSEEGARNLIEFLSNVPIDFVGHADHVKYILKDIYKVAKVGRDELFDFNKSERTPPVVPPDKAMRYKMQAELKCTKLQIQRRLARIEQQGFHKNSDGFLMTKHGTYLITYFGDSVYFEHVDGYAVNERLEIRITGDN